MIMFDTKKIVLLGLITGLAVNSPLNACTNLLVTRGASTDGSTMITYTCDGEFHPILEAHPAVQYAAGDSLDIKDKLSISDVILEDLPAMLVQADVLLNPRTRCAGIPQKLLNYMAAGRPVVSFSGSAKIVIDQVDGLVVENGNIHAFSEAMLELVFNPKLGKTLAAAGLKSMKTQFSWHSAAKKTLAVYYDTLTRHAEK